MPSTRFDLNIVQGSNFDVTIVADDDDGNVVNLTGYSVTGKVKHKYGDTDSLFDLAPSIPSSTVTQGHIVISLPPETTATFPVVQGVYEVEITKGSFGLKTIFGLISVNPQVTT